MLTKRIISEFKLVLEDDPAIDVEKTEYDEYLRKLDPSKLILIPGETPTYFVVKPLGYRQRMAVEGINVLHDRCEMAIRCGLIRIENYRIDGGEMPEMERGKEGDLGEILTRSWIEKANLPKTDMFHVANMIVYISEGKIPLS